MRLDDCLRRTTREPSPDAKVSYIIAEQDGILREIQHLEDAKAKRIQFAFGLIAAYFAYAVAPLTLFHELGTELAAFYALGGFWGSIALLVHSNRFLHFLGDAHRQKGLLRKAFNAHRGYVLGRDRAYYEKTILPSPSITLIIRRFRFRSCCCLM